MAGPYYVDPENGSDAADGLSTSTPWRTIPGQSGANVVAAGTAGNPTIINIKNGTTTTARIVVPQNYLLYRGYGLADNVLEIPLPSEHDPSIVNTVRVVREEGVHEGMWTLTDPALANSLLAFFTRTDTVVEDAYIIGGSATTQLVSVASSSQTGGPATLRRSWLRESGGAGIEINLLNMTMEYVRVEDIDDDGIVFSAQAANGSRSGSVDTCTAIAIINAGRDTVSAIGDALQTTPNGAVYSGKLTVDRLYIDKTSSVKQALQINDASAGITIQNFHIRSAATGNAGISCAYVQGLMKVRNGYVSGGCADNPFVRITAQSSVYTAAAGSVRVANVVVEADGAGLFSAAYGSAGTFDGTAILENCTYTGACTGALSYSGAVSGGSTTVTYGAGALITMRNNALEASGSTAPIVFIPENTPSKFVVKNNAVPTTGAYKILSTDYASLALFEAALSSATGNVSSSDFMLGADSRPLEGSPLIETGLHSSYGTDATGAARWNPPSIGAYEALRARVARA